MNTTATKVLSTIGRSPGNDLVLPHPSVSGRHAQITKQPDGKFQIRDLGSTNGTFVEDQRIKEVTLLDGNAITIGRTTILYWDGLPADEDA